MMLETNSGNTLNYTKPSSNLPLLVSIPLIIITAIIAIVIVVLRSVEAVTGSPSYQFGYSIGSFLLPFFVGAIFTLISMLFVKKKSRRLLFFSIASLLIAILNLLLAINVYSEYTLKEISIPEATFCVPKNWEKPNIKNKSLLTMGDHFATTGIIIYKHENTDIIKQFENIKKKVVEQNNAKDATEIQHIDIKGKPAVFFECTETYNGKESNLMYIGINNGNSSFRITLWVSKAEYAAKKSILYKIRDSFILK